MVPQTSVPSNDVEPVGVDLPSVPSAVFSPAQRHQGLEVELCFPAEEVREGPAPVISSRSSGAGNLHSNELWSMVESERRIWV